MEGKGFEVIVKDEKGNVTIDRHVNNISDGEEWAKTYTKGRLFNTGKEATFYIDGKPQVTHYSKDRK